VINLKGAFHQQCHDCHRKTAGPRSCEKCHHER
jgi:primosomal protein N'